MKWNSSYIQVDFHKRYIYLWHWSPICFFFSSCFCFFIASYLKILLLRQHIYILRRIIFFIYFTCCGVFLNRFDCGWLIRVISQEKKIILGSQKMEVWHPFTGADFIVYMNWRKKTADATLRLNVTVS